MRAGPLATLGLLRCWQDREMLRLVSTSLGYVGVRESRPDGGSGRGAPVVLLHGAGLSSEMWTPQVAALTPQQSVLAIDLFGHGSSAPLTERATDMNANRYLCGLGARGAGRRARPSLRPFLRRDGCTATGRIVPKICEVADSGRDSGVGSLGRVSKSWAPVPQASILRLMPMSAIAAVSARQYGHTDASRTLTRRLLSEMDRRQFLRVWELVDSFDGRPLAGLISSPTLIMAAEENSRTHAQARWLAAAISHAELSFVADASHLPQRRRARRLQRRAGAVHQSM